MRTTTHLNVKHPTHFRRRRAGLHRAGEEGTSLVETLVAAAILLIIAVGIFPIFHRAAANNLSGSDSSKVSHFVRSQAEANLSVSIDSPRFDMTAAASGINPPPPGWNVPVTNEDPAADENGNGICDAGELCMTQGGQMMVSDPVFWDPEANSTRDAADLVDATLTDHLGTGAWITDETAANGLVVWRRTSSIRLYSFADISEGVIDVTSPGQLTTRGHPKLFDRPLPADAPTASQNFKEEKIQVESLRPGVPSVIMKFIRAY